jgi:hypothetical protein
MVSAFASIVDFSFLILLNRCNSSRCFHQCEVPSKITCNTFFGSSCISCLPCPQVYLYWAVREYRQLASLAELSPRLLCPGFESKVTIHVHAYVTRGSKADVSSMEEPRLALMEDPLEHSAVQPMRPQVRQIVV